MKIQATGCRIITGIGKQPILHHYQPCCLFYCLIGFLSVAAIVIDLIRRTVIQIRPVLFCPPIFLLLYSIGPCTDGLRLQCFRWKRCRHLTWQYSAEIIFQRQYIHQKQPLICLSYLQTALISDIFFRPLQFWKIKHASIRRDLQHILFCKEITLGCNSNLLSCSAQTVVFPISNLIISITGNADI